MVVSGDGRAGGSRRAAWPARPTPPAPRGATRRPRGETGTSPPELWRSPPPRSVTAPHRGDHWTAAPSTCAAHGHIATEFRNPSPRSRNLPPSELFRGTRTQPQILGRQTGREGRPTASGPRLALHLNIARSGRGPCTSERIAFGVNRATWCLMESQRDDAICNVRSRMKILEGDSAPTDGRLTAGSLFRSERRPSLNPVLYSRMKCAVTDSHVAWNASAEPGSGLSKRTRAVHTHSGAAYNNIQLNIERRFMREQLDSHRTVHVKTQNTRWTTAEGARRERGGRMQVDPPATRTAMQRSQ